MTFLILFLFFIWDRSLFLFNLSVCMYVSEVFLSRLKHRSLSSHISQSFILMKWLSCHRCVIYYWYFKLSCECLTVSTWKPISLSLSLSLCERIMQLFSCHSGLLQQWLIIIGMWTVCIYGITNHTHIESESETERERQRQREWENGREAQRRWYSRLDWSPGISNSNTAKQGYVYQIVRLLEI